METPLNNCVILSKKSRVEFIQNKSGIEISIDQHLLEVIASDSSILKTGMIVCVPHFKLKEIPFNGNIELYCYTSDVLHYKDPSNEGLQDRTL